MREGGSRRQTEVVVTGWLMPLNGGCRLAGCVMCRMYQLPAEEDERIKARVEASQARRQDQVGRDTHLW